MAWQLPRVPFLVCNVRIDSHILNQIDNLGNMYLLSTFDPVAWATTTCQLKVSLTLESERAAGERDKRGKMHSANTHSSSLIKTKKKNCISRSLVVAETLLGVHYCAIRGKKEST